MGLLMLAVSVGAMGQDVEPQGPVTTLSVRSNLVLVPASVRTKNGEPVFTLKADDFFVTDDGVEQKVRLEEDTGDQPLALVVVVEIGDTPESKFAAYADLGTLLDSIVGGVQHKVAVVGFDSDADVIQPFTGDLDKVGHALQTMGTGDGGASTLDGLVMAVDLLKKQPPTYRRAILLISETVDRGSKAKLATALRAVSDTNTVIYSLGYSTTRATVKHEAEQMGGSSEAGPPHGCMGKYPDVDLEGNPLPPRADLKGQGSSENNKAIQAYDCLSTLAPPLRLAKAAVFAALNALKTNVPEAAAKISGGEYFKVEGDKRLQKDMVAISNRLPNRYFLSFTPTASHPGLHAIAVRLREERVGVKVEARSSYWENN
ncbi:VWA domain-containing protein [Granulicella arctica]|uniref:VWA domain-containing protein n=1 Tax=Granulicella arctica TaxID=940613 RepID=UPI0021DF71E3|nr:VWA domain-containing protein [Granulicella arctica]